MKLSLFGVLCIQFLFLLASCKKDKVPAPIITPIGDNCPEMYNLRSEAYPFEIYKTNALPGCATMFDIIPNDMYNYYNPVQNPLNQFEFAFLRHLNEEIVGLPVWEICTFNFCTNKLTILASNASFGVDWSTNNWLLFRNTEGVFVKIKSNGDSLTTLGLYPQQKAVWSPNGNKILFKSTNNSFTLTDSEGNILSTTNEAIDKWCWLNDEKIIFSRGSTVYTFDINLQLKETLFSLNEINSLNRGRNNSIGISTMQGIYSYSNGQLSLLKNSYKTYFTTSTQLIDDSKYLLLRDCFDTTFYSDCKMYLNRSISIYDVQTQNERRILLPN
jgi:hypothetical protein